MKRKLFSIAEVFLIAVLLFSVNQLWRYFSVEITSQRRFDDLAKRIRAPDPPEDETEAAQYVWTTYDQYGELFAQNSDMIGWLAIEGTAVNYPVMQTPDRPDYYLRRDFEGKYSPYGVFYAAGDCSLDPPSDNITVFGRRTRSGRMFGILERYKSTDFYMEHPMLRFDTRAGFGQYVIIAVFEGNSDEFPYRQFTDAADETEFDAFVSRCKSLSLYDTGLSAVYGDELLTLSNSLPSANNITLVAKRI
jgi:sortase B